MELEVGHAATVERRCLAHRKLCLGTNTNVSSERRQFAIRSLPKARRAHQKPTRLYYHVTNEVRPHMMASTSAP